MSTVELETPDRPALTDRPRKWLSRSMAQLMVFFNGLILTVTAYATVEIFVRQLIADDFRNVTEDTRDIVVDNIADLYESLDSMAFLVALSTRSPFYETDLMNDFVRRQLPERHSFDQIYRILLENGAVTAVAPLLEGQGGRESYDFALDAPDSAFVGRIVSAHMNAPGQRLVLIDLPATDYTREYNGPDAMGRPFALVRPVVEVDGSAGGPGGQARQLIVGLSRVALTLTPDWFQRHENVAGLMLRDVNSGIILFEAGQEGGRVGVAPGQGTDPQTASFQFPVGNQFWDLVVDAQPDARLSFLEKIPLLMLVFGMTLTLVGTLYVRNNQKQSNKLAGMNRALAQKNLELNNEIATRERLNQILRKSERENRAIINAVSDIIFEMSSRGEILFLNETWVKITGMSIEDTMGKSLFDLLHPQDQKEQRDDFAALISGTKQAYRKVTRLKTAKGEYRSVELAMSMLRRDENKDIRVVGTITDVEERRRAEKALGEAERKFRAIVENAAGGIYQMTDEGMYLSANPAMARILGYESPEQLLHEVRDANMQVYAKTSERMQFLRELDKFGTMKKFETQVKRRDGEVIWISESARAVKDEEDNILYYEGGIEDVTQRKRTEIALHKAKLQSDMANRAKSEFLANMSHELRTPLNAIIGFSEIIKNEVFGPVGQKVYGEYATDIYDSGRRLLKVINEILNISQIEAGDRQLNESEVDLYYVAQLCLELAAPKADAGGVIVTNTIAPGGARLIGEELAIKQIIMNLLSNAIKFTPPEGRVTISAETDADGHMRMSLTDTGVGLNSDEVEKALSPFGQVDTSLSRSGSGTGLGLTLVDALVKLHGGTLELLSQKGIGTTATVVFPARRVLAAKLQETPEKPSASS